MVKKIIILMAMVGILLVPKLTLGATANVAVGDGLGVPGAKNVTIPINFSASKRKNVSTLFFEIKFDANKLQVQDLYLNVLIGPSAQAAGKQLEASESTKGTLRVVIYGGRKPLISGSVAYISFGIKETARSGKAVLRINKISGADPNAKSVKLKVNNGKILITKQFCR